MARQETVTNDTISEVTALHALQTHAALADRPQQLVERRGLDFVTVTAQGVVLRPTRREIAIMRLRAQSEGWTLIPTATSWALPEQTQEAIEAAQG